MKTRIILGAIMIAILLSLFGLDWYLEDAKLLSLNCLDGSQTIIRGLPLAIVMLLMASLAVGEMDKMAHAAGMRLLGFSATAGAAAIATMPLWWQFMSANDLPFAALAIAISAVLWATFLEQMIRFRTENAVRSMAATLGTVIYLGVGGMMILQVRMMGESGLARLILFLAAVKFTDIGAYFVGSMIGKRKLIPWLSPGKSWEGLWGGLATAAAISMLTNWLLGTGLAVWQAAVFGVAIGIIGQFGDLCESLLKRSANVKDSGSALPEFGGVLDMIDSPLIAAPLAYVLLLAM